MNNYKTKVNGEAESKEAQKLFEVLGYKKGMCSLGNYPAVIVTTQDWATGSYCSTRALGLDIPAHENYKEITLAELRDMVVLKRNDVNDATHENNFFKYMELTDGWYYFEEKWVKSSGAKPEYYEKLKPIEKTMKKEYLIPQSNGKYALTKATEKRVSDWIEIPEGCNIITREYRAGSIIYFHWKSFDSDEFFLKDERIWSNNFDEALSDFIEKNEGDVVVIWQRQTQLEALPFIDDEPMTMENQIKHSDKEMFDKIRNGDIKLDFSQFDQDDSEKGSTLITVPLIDDAPAGDKKIYTHDELNRMSDDDVVNHPNHYTQGKVECIDALEAATVGKVGIEAVCVANVIKYLWRYENKGGLESILKAKWYLDKLIEYKK